MASDPGLNLDPSYLRRVFQWTTDSINNPMNTHDLTYFMETIKLPITHREAKTFIEMGGGQVTFDQVMYFLKTGFDSNEKLDLGLLDPSLVRALSLGLRPKKIEAAPIDSRISFYEQVALSDQESVLRARAMTTAQTLMMTPKTNQRIIEPPHEEERTLSVGDQGSQTQIELTPSSSLSKQICSVRLKKVSESTLDWEEKCCDPESRSNNDLSSRISSFKFRSVETVPAPRDCFKLIQQGQKNDPVPVPRVILSRR